MPPPSKPTAVVRLNRVIGRPEADHARRTDPGEMQSSHRIACHQERKPASRVAKRPFPIAKLSPIPDPRHHVTDHFFSPSDCFTPDRFERVIWKGKRT